MKRLLAILLLSSLACSACSTLANRRDLYRPLKAKKQTTAKATQESATKTDAPVR